MAGFRVRETGEYLNSRLALEDYRRGKGGVPADITESWLDSIGMDPVFEGPQAQPTDQYGYSQFAGLEQVEGKWYTKYIVGPVFTDPEQEAEYRARIDETQAKSVRSTRNVELTTCDWTQLDDTPLTNAKKLEWAAYRQALRDIPSQIGFPWNVVWPTQPE